MIMDSDRWSDDAFLDTLRGEGDPLADEVVRQLVADQGIRAVGRVFQLVVSNDGELPPDAPREFARFLAATDGLPADVDTRRIARGEAVYFRHAFPVALVLLAKSLPEGYSAPNLTRILALSGDLEHHPYKRLLGVLQMVVNVAGRGGFSAEGRAILTAQKLRLLHAGVRHVADQRLPEYRERFGPPVNHEDMLATIMGFSWLVIEGLQNLDVGLTDDEAEDLYYVWWVFARKMGIHPPGEPDDPTLVPATLADARTFYAAYSRRHFTSAEENPEGTTLARHNLRMMQDLMPRALRRVGLGVVPLLYMNELLTPEARRRVGLRTVPGRRLLRRLLHRLPGGVQEVADEAPSHAERFSRALFQALIDRGRGGDVRFLVPESIADLQRLA